MHQIGGSEPGGEIGGHDFGGGSCQIITTIQISIKTYFNKSKNALSYPDWAFLFLPSFRLDLSTDLQWISPLLYSLFLKYPFISTDTRKIIPGSIFFALKGELSLMGILLLCQPSNQVLPMLWYQILPDRCINLIHVEDTLLTLQITRNPSPSAI